MHKPLPITIFTRPNCLLCDETTDLLEDLGRDWPLELTTINILEDPDLHARYRDQIPVVRIGDEELHAPLNAVRLTAIVARAARGWEQRQS